VRRRLKLPTSRRWRAALAALLPVSALLTAVVTASPASADSYVFGVIPSATVFPNGTPGYADGTNACLDDWQGPRTTTLL
jgi:hypothetical protein